MTTNSTVDPATWGALSAPQKRVLQHALQRTYSDILYQALAGDIAVDERDAAAFTTRTIGKLLTSIESTLPDDGDDPKADLASFITVASLIEAGQWADLRSRLGDPTPDGGLSHL